MINVFKSFRIYDALGNPTIGESFGDWAIDFASMVFNALDTDMRERAIREFFLLVAVKNGKSIIGSALMLTEMIFCERPNAEFTVVAPTMGIASSVIYPAMQMVKGDERFKVTKHINTITYLPTGATLRARSADTYSIEGCRSSGIFVDGFEFFGKMSCGRRVIQNLIGSMLGRPESFIIYSSSMPYEPPAGIFRDKLEDFRQGKPGGMLFEPKDPMNLIESNPNLGRSVDEMWLRELIANYDCPEVRARHLSQEVIAQALKIV